MSTGAAPVRVTGRVIDSGSRGASNDQGGSTGFPDLLSKMGGGQCARRPVRDFDAGAPVHVGCGSVPNGERTG